jgi:hypothetical protein
VTPRSAGRIISIVAFVAIAVATLTPMPGVASLSTPWCIFCGDLGGIDFGANVVMFMPLGLGLAMALGRRWKPVLWCFALTVFVEAMQIRIIPGRDASLGDVVANTLGGLLGAQLGLGYSALLRPTRRVARRFAVAWAGLVSVVLWGTSWGFAASPRLTSLWVQHLPVRAGFEPVPGSLDSLWLEGILLDEMYPTNRRAIADAMAKRSWRAVAALRMHGPPATPGVIARVVEESTVRLSIEQWGADLRCRIKSRASDIKLRDPVVAVPNVFPVRAGTADVPTRATCGRLGATMLAAATTPSGSAEYRMRLSPSLGWVLVWPFNVGVTGKVALLGLAWLIALGLPAGYWLAASRWSPTDRGGGPSPFGALVPPFVVLLAFVLGEYLAPRVFDVEAASATESLATLIGIVVGGAVYRLATRARPLPNAEPASVSLRAGGPRFVLPDESS